VNADSFHGRLPRLAGSLTGLCKARESAPKRSFRW
jgi:hypothetical protein